MNKLMLAVLSAAALISSTAQAERKCTGGNCRTEKVKPESCVRCGRIVHPTHRNRCMCPAACATVTESSCTMVCPKGSQEKSRIPSTKVNGCDEVVCETMVPKTVRPVKTVVKRVVKTCGPRGTVADKSNRRYNRA